MTIAAQYPLRVDSIHTAAPGQMTRRGCVREGPAGVLGDSCGTATIEYLVVTLSVSLIGAAAIFAVGVPLLARFRMMQALIMLPIP